MSSQKLKKKKRNGKWVRGEGEGMEEGNIIVFLELYLKSHSVKN